MQNAPAVKERNWSKPLVIDPPKEGGIRVGDVVLVWHGEPEVKACPSFVTLVGPGDKLSVTSFAEGWASGAPHDNVLPHDDPEYIGRFPTAYRWKPAPASVVVKVLESRIKAIEVQIAELVKLYSMKFDELTKKLSEVSKKT